MRNIVEIGIFLTFVAVLHAKIEVSEQIRKNETVHIFVLMVPDSDVERLRRLRQEEVAEEAVSFAQTSQLLGQIIRGVLGGDVRPIFAGSVGFVDDTQVQQGVGGFLNAIGPVVNLALRELYTRGQTYFGITTPSPATLNATASSNVTVYEGVDDGGNDTMKAAGQDMMMMMPAPRPTSAWEYVLNQIYASTSTAEPLPFITQSSSGGDGDVDNEDYKDSNKVFFDY